MHNLGQPRTDVHDLQGSACILWCCWGCLAVSAAGGMVRCSFVAGWTLLIQHDALPRAPRQGLVQVRVMPCTRQPWMAPKLYIFRQP